MKLDTTITPSPTAKAAQKWAVTLCCEDNEKLEARVARIVEHLARYYEEPKQWEIADLDATGSLGNRLTRQGNDRDALYLSDWELLEMLQEDGQAIELDAALVKNGQKLFKISIRDGCYLDVLGTGEILPNSVLGNYNKVDRELFLW